MAHSSLSSLCSAPVQPMFSVTPGLATNASAAAAAAAAFNPYLSPVSPGLMPPEILPSTPVLMASSPNVGQVPNAAAAAAQKLLRTDRLEVTDDLSLFFLLHFLWRRGCIILCGSSTPPPREIQENSNKLRFMMCVFLSGSGTILDDNEPLNKTSVVNKWFNRHMSNSPLYWTCKKNVTETQL